MTFLAAGVLSLLFLQSVPGYAGPGQTGQAGTQPSAAAESPDSFLFVTGQVVGPDGLPPREPLRVEIVCGGQVTHQVLTSRSGSFRFEIGRRQPQGWMDASATRDPEMERSGHWNSSIDKPGTFAASTMKTFNLNGCEIRVSGGQGFEADPIRLGSRSTFDKSDVGVLILFPQGQGRGLTVSVKTLSAPPNARAAFDKASEEFGKTKPNYRKASGELTRAVEEYPEFSAAWELLGRVRFETKDYEGSREAFERAIEIEPSYVNSYLGLTRLSLFEEKWEEAAQLTGKVLALAPRSQQACYFNGLANFQLNRFGAAENSYSQLEAIGGYQSYPIALFHLGIIHAQQGKIAQAGAEFERYLSLMPGNQVPPGQREKLVRQLEQWRRQGLLSEGTPPAALSPDPRRSPPPKE